MPVRRGRTTKAERAQKRAKLGPLQDLTVAKRTKTLYTAAMAAFSLWMQIERVEWPDDPWELDPLLCEYAQECWQEGETKATYANLLSALGDAEADIKPYMHAAWRLKTAWDKNEASVRCTPMTPSIVLAMAGLAFKWKWADTGFTLLIAYHCLLRTGEACSIRIGDLVFGDHTCTLNLPKTKSSVRTGVPERATIEDARLISALRIFIRGKAKGDYLQKCSPQQFRKRFKQLLQGLQLQELYLIPYSLRRGGATQLFRDTNQMDLVADRGRWSNVKTARIYVDAALQDLDSVKIGSKAKQLMAAAEKVLLQHL